MTDLSLAFCRIESPIAGLVTEWCVRRGRMVAGGGRIARRGDTSTLFAQAQLPRRARARGARGAPVEGWGGGVVAGDSGEAGAPRRNLADELWRLDKVFPDVDCRWWGE